jgi:hypothetical protein
MKYLEEAISVGWETVKVTPQDHPEQAERLHNLGHQL